MESERLNKIKLVLSEIFCICFISVAAYPGMLFTGRLGFQIGLTVFLSLFITMICDLIGIGMKSFSHAICITIVFWVSMAVIGQMIAKGTVLFFLTPWQYMFYYDRIGMIFIVLIVVTMYLRLKAFLSKSPKITKEYERFYSVVSVAFTVFYIIVLAYCFFIVRTPNAAYRPQPNLVPFEAFRSTFLSGMHDYESYILFLGNIAIFIPLGYLLYDKFKNGKIKFILIVIPIILSCGIEFSQLKFNMGHFDVDDIILNVIGFYCGVLFKLLIDKVMRLKKD